MVWYSHLFQNFPQFVVIHTVKGFGIVNKAEILIQARGGFQQPQRKKCVGQGLSGSPGGASFKWNRHLTLDKQLQRLHGLSQAFIADTESWHWQPLLERYQAAAAASQMPTYGDTTGNEQDEV